MQRVSLAIVHIHEQNGYFLLCYADDFSGAEIGQRAWHSYNTLGRLFRDLGVPEALEKSVPPSEEIVFLGTGINAVTQVIFVVPERIVELVAELDWWRWLEYCTRQELESLMGKLQFCGNCVRPGCLFISRMLSELKGMKPGRRYSISASIKMDAKWWWNFLPHFKASYLIWPQQFLVPDQLVASDASLRSAGAVCGTEYYHVDFPDWLLQSSISIADLELVAVILCFKRWTSQLSGKKVVVNCDNQVVVSAINNGQVYSKFLQEGLCELVFLCCCNAIEIQARYIRSVDNRLPDFLSWWNLGSKYRWAFVRD